MTAKLALLCAVLVSGSLVAQERPDRSKPPALAAPPALDRHVQTDR